MTGGEYVKIGTLYGFTLLIETETSLKDGLSFRDNRFFAEGNGNVKYSYNNGHIANDPVLASQNFLKALEKMPSLIETHETKAQSLEKDIPALQEIVKFTWRKEDELKGLKTELAALDKKIQLSLKPIDQSEDKLKAKQAEKPADLDVIHRVMSGKIHPKDMNKYTIQTPQHPVLERLQAAKQEMGDRLIIASVPKFEPANKPQRIKL
ncbi:MAG: hypothetical protein LBR10_13060 [Prevotellaceae bacterium]|jgi:septal ring factor EnvC (AmiA/AmiB activator)|nr:hypothetical protein [Prevotellaceae bacterium]